MNLMLCIPLCLYFKRSFNCFRLHDLILAFFFTEEPRNRCHGRTAALMGYCATLWGRWWRSLVFFVYPCNGAPMEWNWQGKTEVLGEKLVPVPLCPPQIPHGPIRNRTWVSAVSGRRITARAMARPIFDLDSNMVILKNLFVPTVKQSSWSHSLLQKCKLDGSYMNHCQRIEMSIWQSYIHKVNCQYADINELLLFLNKLMSVFTNSFFFYNVCTINK
jgi:hypothetical protein